MRTRIAFVLGAGLGYVFGTRAGREKYEQLTRKADELWRHPKVQEQMSEAKEALHTVVTEHVPHLAKRAAFAARDALGLELPER